MYDQLKSKLPAVALLAVLISAAGCEQKATTEKETVDSVAEAPKFLNEPLIKEIYTADPSAHVFNGKIYVYPSHDIDAGIPNNDNGDQYAMADYHVLSMDSVGGKVTDKGVALDVKDVPWASKQMWAPDAAYKNGTYYLYFPVRDKEGAFKSLLTRIIFCHVQELGKMLLLALHIGVQKTHIPFSATPEDVVFTTQTDCSIQSSFHLCASMAQNMKIRIG